MVGKWHLGHYDEYWPTAHGFDEFFGVAYSSDMRAFDLYHHKTVVQTPADQRELTNATPRRPHSSSPTMRAHLFFCITRKPFHTSRCLFQKVPRACPQRGTMAMLSNTWTGA